MSRFLKVGLPLDPESVGLESPQTELELRDMPEFPRQTEIVVFLRLPELVGVKYFESGCFQSALILMISLRI